MDMKSIALYGASSFTGQAIVPAAVKSGLRVHAVGRTPIQVPPEFVGHVSQSRLADDSTFTFTSYDKSADVAVHLIAPKGILDGASARDVVNAGMASLISLFEAAVSGSYRRVIYTGSYWQYGEAGDKVAATTLYSALKNAADEIALFYAHRIDVINLILFDSYGPNDPRQKILSLVDEAAQSGKPLDMTEGQQYLWPIYSGDLAEAFLAAASLDSKIGLRRFWIPGPERLTLRQMIETYCRSRKLTVDIHWGARAYPCHTSNPFVGVRVPNWRAKVTFDRGIEFL